MGRSGVLHTGVSKVEGREFRVESTEISGVGHHVEWSATRVEG